MTEIANIKIDKNPIDNEKTAFPYKDRIQWKGKYEGFGEEYVKCNFILSKITEIGGNVYYEVTLVEEFDENTQDVIIKNILNRI